MVDTGKVGIQLFKGGVRKAMISARTPNDGAFDWTVPPTLPVGSDYKIKVSWLGNPTVINAWSDQFPVVAPTMMVNQPAGGEIWDQKTTKDVTWSCGKGFVNVKIELYKGAVRFKQLVASTPNTGVKTITVPAVRTTASDYRVKVIWLTNPRIFGWSGGFITVRKARDWSLKTPTP